MIAVIQDASNDFAARSFSTRVLHSAANSEVPTRSVIVELGGVDGDVSQAPVTYNASGLMVSPLPADATPQFLFSANAPAGGIERPEVTPSTTAASTPTTRDAVAVTTAFPTVAATPDAAEAVVTTPVTPTTPDTTAITTAATTVTVTPEVAEVVVTTPVTPTAPDIPAVTPTIAATPDAAEVLATTAPRTSDTTAVTPTPMVVTPLAAATLAAPEQTLAATPVTPPELTAAATSTDEEADTATTVSPSAPSTPVVTPTAAASEVPVTVAPVTTLLLDFAALAHNNIVSNPSYAGIASSLYVNAMIHRAQQTSAISRRNPL